MSKSKKSIKESIKKSGKYLREISVVVIGVAITLSVSYWIGVKNEKRDMALHLKAITMELQENTGEITSLVQYLKLQCRYVDYLQSNDKNSLDKDTVSSYFYICYAPPLNFTFKANAFEMFKNSGTMRLMSDKELLIGIWDIYDNMIILKELINEHNRLKWNFIEKEISLFDVNRGEIEWNTIPMYDFYKKTNASKRLLGVSEIIAKNIHEIYLKLVITQFENSKIKRFKLSDEDLDKYLGIYTSNQLPNKLIITKENKKLLVQLTEIFPFSYPFFATAENIFEFEGVILELNPTEKTMVVKRNGQIFNFVRED